MEVLARAARAHTLLVSLLAASAASQAPLDPSLRARFGLLGPTIHKVGPGTGLLRLLPPPAGGQGATIVVNDGRRGRLTLLRLTGETLAEETRSTPGEIVGLAAGDADGDGVADFLLLDGRGRLRFEPRGKGGVQPRQIDVGVAAASDALATGDLDGDGKIDAVVLTREGLRAVLDPAGACRVSPPDPVPAQRVHTLRLLDADGDGRLDVVLATSDEDMALRVRRGRGDGGFGPWLVLDASRVIDVFAGAGEGGRPTFGTVEGAHRRIVEYRLTQRDAAQTPGVELYSLPEAATGPRGPRPFAHGDLDGDGDPDLVLADEAQARLFCLLEEGGSFRVETAPTLSAIDSLALGDIDADGKQDLLLASAEEGTVAWKSGALPLGAFPARLPRLDQPTTPVFDGTSVLFLARDDKRQGRLHRLRRDGEAWKVEKVLDLDRLPQSPLRLLCADLDGKAGPDLAWVQPGEGLRVLFADGSGGYSPLDPNDRDAGFTRQIADGALSLVSQVGSPALMVVRERFARFLRFDGERRSQILEQDNGPPGVQEFTLMLRRSDGVTFCLDGKASKLYRMEPGRPVASVDVPRQAWTHLLAHEGSALLVGRTGVVRVPFSGPAWGLSSVRVHEPVDEKSSYYAALGGDLDGDGRAEIVVADAHVHGYHVLVAGDGKLARALTFPVFEAVESGPGREPREAVTGDVDGDGRDDLVVLCHDRVLVYLQER